MNLTINTGTPGLDNRPSPEKASTNLMQQAIELAKDGHLSTEDCAKLKETSLSDNETSATEALFLSSLEQDPVKFAETVAEAVKKGNKSFDPATVQWDMSTTLKLKGPQGEIRLDFKPERLTGLATSATETSGGSSSLSAAKASQDRLRMDYFITTDKKPDFETQKAWQKVDKFDLAAVRSFLDSQNLAPDKKAAFVQDYLNGYFAHTGEGAEWGAHTDIQQLLPLLPADGAHRKFIDCETFTALTQILLENVTPYVVDGDEKKGGKNRNHQVAVVRIGEQGFIQSNQKLQPIKNAAKLSDEAMILAYTNSKNEHTLSRPARDVSGPLITGSEVWDIGESVTVKDSNNVSHVLTITEKIDETTVEGIDENKNRFKVDVSSEAVTAL